MTTLVVQEFDLAVRAEQGLGWGELLARSGADPLFSSQEWLEMWWRHHGAQFGLEPFVLEARADGRLVGLACMHRRLVRHGPLVRGTRVELSGNLWRTPGATMSERTGFIVDREFPEAYAALAERLLASRNWKDVVVAYTDVEGETCRSLVAAAVARGFYWRQSDELLAFALALDGGFPAVLGRFSANTRRHVYNHRRKLAELGEVAWETAGPRDLDEFFESLDRLHLARWGWRASSGRRGRMYREFAERLAARDELRLCRLRVGERVIAASLAFRACGCEYDIQRAFDPEFSRALSPGSLQTGYSLEHACADGMRRFDFLGGDGKSTDYKTRLASERTHLTCLQIVRDPLLASVHRFADRVGRERLKRLRSGGSW